MPAPMPLSLDGKNINHSINRAAPKQTPAQRRRIRAYFFDGMTLEKIAMREGVSKQSVSISIQAALQNLRKYLKTA